MSTVSVNEIVSLARDFALEHIERCRLRGVFLKLDNTTLNESFAEFAKIHKKICDLETVFDIYKETVDKFLIEAKESFDKYNSVRYRVNINGDIEPVFIDNKDLNVYRDTFKSLLDAKLATYNRSCKECLPIKGAIQRFRKSFDIKLIEIKKVLSESGSIEHLELARELVESYNEFCSVVDIIEN